MIDASGWRTRCLVAYLDEPPFFAPVAGGEPIGCDIELATMVLARLEVERVEFVLTTFDQLIDGVRSDLWHINTPIFMTPERARLVAFSIPVWAVADGFIVRSDDRRDFGGYATIAADATIRVGVVTGQVQHRAALNAGIPPERIAEFADQDTAANAVLDGRIDASASTAPGNRAYIARRGDSRLIARDDTNITHQGNAFGAYSFNRAAVDLIATFNGALRELLGTPRHIDMMRTYGFTHEELQPVIDAARKETT